MATTTEVRELGTIELPAPDWEPARPLLKLLRARHSTREFSARSLEPNVLGSLLWAAFGVNREDSGGRTAPSAHDWREIEVFAVLANDTYRYDPPTHSLHLVKAGDLRPLTGVQDFVGAAPLNLVYVADFSKMVDANEEQRTYFAAADAGVIAQNVYLFCACTGLATVVRGLVDRRRLAPALGLARHQRIVLAQSIGYPR